MAGTAQELDMVNNSKAEDPRCLLHTVIWRIPLVATEIKVSGVLIVKMGDKVEHVLGSCLNGELTFASRESCLWAW